MTETPVLIVGAGPVGLGAAFDWGGWACDPFWSSAIRRQRIVPSRVNLAFWTRAAQIAEHFKVGGIFLAGDAAHRFPFTVGFGANTGIQDVHNLAWKLAAVLQGWAAPSLLETYEEERRPIAQANTEFSVTNGRRWDPWNPIIGGDDAAIAAALKEQVTHLDSEGQDLGFWYANRAVVPDGSPAPRRLGEATCGAPVTRAEQSERGPGNRRDEGWRAAGRQTADELGVPFASISIEPGGNFQPEQGDWMELHGLERDGAVLVRSDGHIAWRARSRRAKRTLVTG
jgi:putative polyketide hydroxylase